MSTIEIKVPALGESVVEATVGKWYKQADELATADTVLVELETDKVTLEVYAPTDGSIQEIFAKSGTRVKIEEVLAKFTAKKIVNDITKQNNQIQEKVLEKSQHDKLEQYPTTRREELRAPMSRLRQKIAERLKNAQNTAAMLTTFNEVDMSAISQLRTLYKENFEKKHGVKLGFMSFFVKSCVQALQEQPIINSCIDGDEIVTKNYFDIGIAVSTPNGLVVPIIRNADTLSISDIEKTIAELGKQGRDGKLSADEITGGTFTITNGGVFGSLLSTPIINPPQSAILGMHKIQDRPIVVNGQIVIRPMMYLALSYDHRLIDGKEAVTFLVTIKDYLENPGKFLLSI